MKIPNTSLDLTPEEFKRLKSKYAIHRQNTKKRLDRLGNPIKFNLTFDEWASIWINSGHVNEMGIKSNQYCMSRKNDIGDYEVNNVEIKTMVENIREAIHGTHKPGRQGLNQGIKRSELTRERMSQSHKGYVAIRNKPLQTPNGVFENLQAAAEHYGVTKEAIHYFKRRYPTEYYYLD